MTDTTATTSKSLPHYTRRHSLLNLHVPGDDDTELAIPERFIHESSYRQTVIYLLALAVHRLFPERELIIQSNYSFLLHTRSYHCRFKNHTCSKDDITSLTTEMERLKKSSIPIEAKYLEHKECLEHFLKTKQLYSAKLVESLNESRYKVAGCEIEGDKFYTLSQRPFLANTNYLKEFGLFNEEGSDLDQFIDDFDDFEIGNADATDEKNLEDTSVLANYFIIVFPSKSDTNRNITKPEIATSVKRLYAQGVKLGKMLGLECVGDLNKMIQKGHGKELILLSEAYHDMQIVNIARQIRRKRRESKGGLKVILISGPSSSGKTTFANKLCIQLKLLGLNPVSLEVDMFYREHSDPDYPKFENGLLNFETIDAMRLDYLQECLQNLFSGKEIEVPNFSLGTGKVLGVSQRIKLPKNGVLVMEGIFCLNPKLTSSLSDESKFKIFMCPISYYNLDNHHFLSEQVVRLVRRVSRDYLHRNRGANKTLFKWGQLQGGEDENIFPYVENADCVFNSTLAYEVPVLKVFTKPLLQTISSEEAQYKDARNLKNMLNCFSAMPNSSIPSNSVVQEFIGTSIYDELE